MTADQPTVAVVGAGAAGALTAIHLAAAARDATRPLRMVLADPAPHEGRGVAYSTTDDQHLLNVPAGRMSAWPQDPGDFTHWLLTQGTPGAGPTFYAPRAQYGRYLAETLAAITAQAPVTIDRVHQRVTGAGRHGAGVHLAFDDGSARYADHAILAIGSAPPCTAWAPPALTASPRFIADPWAPGALAAVDGESVLLVGTSLTMVDVALTLSRAGRRLHAISRHGLLPTVHATRTLPQMDPPSLPAGPLRLTTLRRALRHHVAASVAAHGDWRPAIDSLRPVTTDLWRQLPHADRAEFLRRDLRSWEVRRHRMAPAVGARLRSLLHTGSLQVAAGEVVGGSADSTGITITFADGRTRRFDTVVNCTGPRCDFRTTGDPLLRSLLDSGLTRPGEVGLGLDTDADGRLLDHRGTPSPALWTLGAARRGQLWECTAIPEIRGHAQALARTVMAAARPQRTIDAPSPAQANTRLYAGG